MNFKWIVTVKWRKIIWWKMEQHQDWTSAHSGLCKNFNWPDHYTTHYILDFGITTVNFISNYQPPQCKPSDYLAVNALACLLDMIDCPSTPNPTPTPQQHQLDSKDYHKWKNCRTQDTQQISSSMAPCPKNHQYCLLQHPWLGWW